MAFLFFGIFEIVQRVVESHLNWEIIERGVIVVYLHFKVGRFFSI